MPVPLVYLAVASVSGGVLFTSLGFFVGKTGEAVDDVSNGFVKAALVSGGLYLGYHYMKRRK